jgi:tetratricopeptide (TPR) repeat protein
MMGRASEAAWSLIEEFAFTAQRSIFAMDIGWARTLLGDLERAEELLRPERAALVAIGETGARCTIDGVLADVLRQTGHVDEAIQLAEEGIAIAAPDDLDGQARSRAALAEALSLRGEHARAEEAAREAVALVEPTDYLPLKGTVFDALGDVFQRAGRVDEARRAFQRAIEVHRQKGNIVSAAGSRAALERLRVSHI